MELPKHIADMCGVIMNAETNKIIPPEEYQAIREELDADGTVQISYRDSVVGWISEIKAQDGPKYRALSRVTNRIDRFYTQSLAMSWLIEESF